MAPGCAPAALAAVSLLLCPPAPVRASDGAPIAAAAELVARGDLAAAEAAYGAILEKDAARRDARLGRAHVRSFRRDFAGAGADFEALLAADPSDVDALTGLGHALAWEGEHAAAADRFRRALELAPQNVDAAKGLAWSALWRGDAAAAVRRFEAITRDREDAELQAGLGESLLRAGRPREARAAFARSLALDPGREDARIGLASTRQARLRLDATVLGGLTASDGRAESGLRFAEVALSPAEHVRAWAQYDDSLGLDNVALARRGVRAPALYAGGLLGWGRGHATRLEAGWRGLEGTDQLLVRAEQVLAVRAGTFVKAGAWLAAGSSERVEAVGHAAVSFPAARSLRLEPAVLVARSAPGEHDLRLLLSGEYLAGRGVDLGAGIGAGRTSGAGPGTAGTPVSAFARASFPLRRAARAQVLASHERPASGPSITVLAAGLSFTTGATP